MPSIDLIKYYIDQARARALHSNDPRTKTGACIVRPGSITPLVWACNGFPHRVNDQVPVRWEVPQKYGYVEHAERNVIYSAARFGLRTDGCAMFVTDPPCDDCARAIIQSGIKSLYIPQNHSFKGQSSWTPRIMRGLDMLREAGVHVEWVDC
jgi:dCMP deaminase